MKRLIIIFMFLFSFLNLNANKNEGNVYYSISTQTTTHVKQKQTNYGCGAMIGVIVGNYNSFEVYNNFIFAEEFEMNSVFNIKTFILNDKLMLNTGMGVGSLFTDRCTDHHYHTYNIGVESVVFQKNKFKVSIEPSFVWKTYAEHIGLVSERWYVLVNLKFYYNL